MVVRMSKSERASEVRVLLADDSSAFRRTLRALLDEVPGVQVVGEAADADEAVAVAENTNPDVVLLDLVMPGGGGASAAQRIKSAARSRRVILMSLLEQRELALAARTAGADGFISKSEIDTRLREALDLGA
jgi:DNA-binding NarL/FixJ family response regulator